MYRTASIPRARLACMIEGISFIDSSRITILSNNRDKVTVLGACTGSSGWELEVAVNLGLSSQPEEKTSSSSAENLRGRAGVHGPSDGLGASKDSTVTAPVCW